MKKISQQIKLIGARLTLSLCSLLLFSAAGLAQSTSNVSEFLNGNKSSDRTDQSSTSQSEQTEVRELASALPKSHSFEQMSVEQLNIDAQRPSFVPVEAYSNDAMVAPYHGTDVNSLGERTSSTLPGRIKLSPAVAQFWTGSKVEPFWVSTVADGDHPGNFRFFSEYADGPKGWLQNTGNRSAWGNPEFRYWFDQN
jgi:hypothetical protein